MLVENLEQSWATAKECGDDDALRDRSLLTAACWQLRDNSDGSKDTEHAKQDDSDAALELAAVAVAADLTSASSDLSQKILDALDWEVRR